MGVADGTEDLVLVVPKNLEPGAEVGSVGIRVVEGPRSAIRKTLASSARSSSLA